MTSTDALAAISTAREKGERPNLRGSDLRDSDLRGSNLRGSDLRYSDLRYSDLSYSDLSNSDLRGSDLRGSDLSGCTGLLNPTKWLKQQFKRDKLGYLVYKAQQAQCATPAHWQWKPRAALTEVCNPLPTLDCACGVNFATLDWIKGHNYSNIWLCRIRWEDLPGVVVPYNTDGKARCNKLMLIRPLEV